MKRFVVFPLVLGIGGTFFIVLCAAQGIFPQLPYISAFSSPGRIGIDEQLAVAFQSTWLNGLIIGLLLGIALAIWDLLRNRRIDAAATRLILNTLWCWFYATALILFNSLLAFLTSYYFAQIGSKPATLILVLPFVSAGLLNLTAILWATIRSITTDDILTPRVLRDKLRQRSRLQ